jgi:glycosyltransferase involved in cell wall biosynthesis
MRTSHVAGDPALVVVTGAAWPVPPTSNTLDAGVASMLGEELDAPVHYIVSGHRNERVAMGRITFWYLRGGAAGFVLRATRLATKLLRQDRTDAGAVLMSSDVLGAVVGRLAYQRGRAGLLVQVQGEVLRPSADYGSWPRRALMGRLMRAAVGRAAVVRAVNQGLADMARGLNRAGTVQVLGARVDVLRFAPGPPQAQRSRDVAVVGSLVALKNHAVLLRAWPAVRLSVPDARLVFVGDGPERSELTRLIGELGIESHVVLLGAVPHDEVAEVLRSAAVCALPSRTEGSPRAVLEAMACCTAVVVSDIPALREVVDDGVDGLTADPTSPEQWSDQITRLLLDGALRERLGAAGRERVLRQHEFGTWSAQYLALIRRAVGGRTSDG